MRYGIFSLKMMSLVVKLVMKSLLTSLALESPSRHASGYFVMKFRRVLTEEGQGLGVPDSIKGRKRTNRASLQHFSLSLTLGAVLPAAAAIPPMPRWTELSNPSSLKLLPAR